MENIVELCSGRVVWCVRMDGDSGKMYIECVDMILVMYVIDIKFYYVFVCIIYVGWGWWGIIGDGVVCSVRWIIDSLR